MPAEFRNAWVEAGNCCCCGLLCAGAAAAAANPDGICPSNLARSGVMAVAGACGGW